MLQRASRRLILIAVLFTVGVSAALAQAEKVYVTRTGKKYHRASCTSLRSSKIEMPLAEAATRYGACKICRPPVPTPASQTTPVEQRPSSPASAAPGARSTRCQATTKQGTQCSRNAKAGSSYCWQHGG
jgi:hypothetical protein